MMKPIVIIGGGIAGLTSAYRLKQKGFNVKVLEGRQHIGGAMFSVSKDGYISEFGPNTILETSPLVTDLVEELGLGEDKLYANDESSNRYILRDGKPLPLPSAPIPFLKTRLFSFMAKLRLIKEPFIAGWDNSYEESLSQFVVRRLGQEFLDYAINPFVAGVYAGDPDTLSVNHAFPKLYALEQKYGSLIKGQIKGAKERKKSNEVSKQSARMFSFTDGLRMLPEKLAEKLTGDVLTQATVKAINQGENNSWSVDYDTNGGSQTIEAAAVIYAGRLVELADTKFNGDHLEEFKTLGTVYHPPVSALVMGFDRSQVSHPLDGFGVLIPKVEGKNILGTLFSSTLFPNRAPEGKVLLTNFIGGTRQPENAILDQDELVKLTLKDLKDILGVSGEPEFIHHVYWKEAVPQYDVGYGRMKTIMNDLEEKWSGLFFTGNYRSGISAADTIVNAWELSERIPDYLTQTKG